MLEPRAEIGIFGGSGFYSFFDHYTEVVLETPYGAPSDRIALGEVAGRRVAFLPRHGHDHRLLPSQVPYRANVWAMAALGVQRLFGPCAAGSLQAEIGPGHFVFCDQFVDWTRRVEQTSTLLNPADVIAWNTDKTYLRDLEERGLPIVPTIWLDPEKNMSSRAINSRLPAFGEFVIKPTISAGSRDTGRYDASATQQRMLAITHAKNLMAVGRHVMLQRYLRAVDTVGETGMVYLDGTYSHAVRKSALLSGPFRPGDLDGALYRGEVIAPREPSEAERALGDRVIEALVDAFPGLKAPLLYTRVDVIPDDEGRPVILEVELTEPSLFLEHGEGSAERAAEAIAARL